MSCRLHFSLSESHFVHTIFFLIGDEAREVMRKESQEFKRQWNDEILEKDAVNKTNEELRE